MHWHIGMMYEIEPVVKTLKTARENKGLSQRALAQKAGVPQGHISKIENGSVDVRLSSLIALARALELELVLVPRKAVPAVQTIARSSTVPRDDQPTRQAHNELKRLRDAVASSPEITKAPKELAQLQRHLRDLQHFPFSMPDLQSVRSAGKALKAWLNDPHNLNAIHAAAARFQTLRNALAHASANAPPTEPVQPAYSVDDEDDHA
jgi:transcriptional regulator with XRE-family HTH domain